MMKRSYRPDEIINKLKEAGEEKLLSPLKRRKMVIKVYTSLTGKTSSVQRTFKHP